MDDELTCEEVEALNDLRQRAQLGREAMRLRESNLGRHILGRARDERETIVRELLLANPMEWKRIQELQQKAQVTVLIEEWLNQAISEGIEAEHYLNRQED